MEETEFADMFSRYGEIQEPYSHKEKGFGFVKMVSNIVDRVVIKYVHMFLACKFSKLRFNKGITTCNKFSV